MGLGGEGLRCRQADQEKKEGGGGSGDSHALEMRANVRGHRGRFEM